MTVRGRWLAWRYATTPRETSSIMHLPAGSCLLDPVGAMPGRMTTAEDMSKIQTFRSHHGRGESARAGSVANRPIV